MIKARLSNAAALAAGSAGPARKAGEMTPLEVNLTVLSGTELYHFIPELGEEPSLDHGWGEYTRFVFDLDTLEFNPSVPLDFNHDDREVIGGISLAVEDGKLVGRGAIVPFRPGDRAAEVAYKSQFVPYGVSPLVTFDEASAVRLQPGQSAAVSGHTYEGPITIIQHARILGAAVTPYPTDTGTGVSAALTASRKGVLTMSILKPDTADNSAELSANLIVNGGATNENPDLPDSGAAAGPGTGGNPAADPGQAIAEPDTEPAGGEGGGPDTPDTGDGGKTGGEGGEPDPPAGGEGDGEAKVPDPEPDGGEGAGGDGGGDAAGTAALSKEIESLRNEVNALREELNQTRAAALAAHGAEPAGFSHGGSPDGVSYADHVKARLAKLNQ